MNGAFDLITIGKTLVIVNVTASGIIKFLLKELEPIGNSKQ